MASLTSAQAASLTATAQGISNTIANNASAINNASASQKAALSSGLSNASAGLANYARSGGGSSSSTPRQSTPAITPASLTAPAPAAVPSTPVATLAPDVVASNAGVTGANSNVTQTGNTLTVNPIVQQSLDSGKTALDTYMASVNSASTAQPTAAAVQAKVVADSHQQQYQRAVNDYTSQINTIVANRDATNLSLTGQGRGIPEAIIGGQQAEVNKEAAIKTLPIQALLANAQGNLDTANQYINTWGKILTDDANNKYNHSVATAQAVYDFANAQDKTKLDSLLAQQKTVKDTAIALASAKTAAISQALGQGAPSSVVTNITNAPDLTGVAVAAGKYNGDILGNQLKVAQIGAANASAAKTRAEANAAAGVGSNYIAGANPTVDSHIQNVLNGNETMAQVPAGLRNMVSVGLTQQPTASYSPIAASRFATASNRIVSNFIALPQYQLTANGLPYLQRIDAAIKNPGSVSDQDLLDSLTKLNTAGNAISDAQVKLITDGRSFSDAVGVFQNKFENGGVLSQGQRNQIQTIAKGIYANYQKGYEPVYNQVTSQLKEAGIPPAFWSVPNLNNLAAQSGAVDATSPAAPTIPLTIGSTGKLSSGITYTIK